MMLPFSLRILLVVEGKLAQDEIGARLCHAVPDSLDALALACWTAIHGDIRPAIRQSLEPFALRDGQATDGTGILRSLPGSLCRTPGCFVGLNVCEHLL